MKQSWLTRTLFLAILKVVDVQFAMPMFAPPPPPQPMVLIPPPPPPVPYPVGVPYPVPVPVIVTKKTTTTTTTTEGPDNNNEAIGIAVPLPFGFPMPFAVPQAPPPSFCADKPRPKQCPPCPPCICTPSCTPSFYSYCSPCHQKCRCRGNGNAPSPEPPRPPPPMPMPMLSPPMPMPVYPMQQGPPPVFIYPFPPAIPYRRPPRRIINESENDESCSWRDKRHYRDSESSSSSDSGSDSDYDRRRKIRRRKTKVSRNYRKTAKNKESMGTDEETGSFRNEKKLVKPMLSYISKKGDVKYQRKISEDDAAKLIRESDIKSAEVVRRSGYSNRKDKRKVVFSPPLNKNIANLTVSFNVV